MRKRLDEFEKSALQGYCVARGFHVRRSAAGHRRTRNILEVLHRP